MIKVVFSFVICVQLIFGFETFIESHLLQDCENGKAQACLEIGKKHYYGDNINANKNVGIEYITKACKLREGEACYKLGNIYSKGKKNYNESASFHNKGCELNNGKSCNNLGIIYKLGRGVKKDYNMALKLFDKACMSEDGAEKGCANKEELIELMKSLDI